MLRSLRYGEADRILHLYTPGAGTDERHRQGRPPGPEPVRRAAGAVLPDPDGAARGAQRSAHGDRGGHHRGPRRPARARGDARLPPRGPATPSPGCSRPRIPTQRCSTCSRRSWRCSAPTRCTPRPRTALAFRLKLLLAAGIVPQLASCAACGEAEHLRALLGGGRRRRLQLLRGGRVHPRRGGLRVPHRRPRPAAGRGAGRVRARPAPGRAGDRRDRRASCARAAAAVAARRLIGGSAGHGARIAPVSELTAHRHPDGAVAAAFAARIQEREARELSPLAVRSYPPSRPRAGGRLRPAHAVSARSRPHRPLQVVPPAQAQDPGVRLAARRPLPDPAHPHPRGDAGLAHRRPRPAPQRGPGRGDRPRSRPRPSAVRPHRRGGARPLPAGALRPASFATTSTACGSSRCSSAMVTASTSPTRCATGSSATRGGPPRRQPSRVGSSGSSTASRTSTTTSTTRCAPGCWSRRSCPPEPIAVLGQHRTAADRHARPRSRRALRAGGRDRAGRGGGRGDGRPAPLHVRAGVPGAGGAAGGREDPLRHPAHCSTASAPTRRRSRRRSRRASCRAG